MKRILLGLLLAMPFIMSAQLNTGDKLPGNITGTDVINGTPVDVQAWLNEGKTVVVDVFATWCGPCWSFHRAMVLENLYEQYGPDGTDQIMVLGLEGDNRTTSADLEGTGSNTLGNWLEGVKYPVMDDASFNTMLNIAFFPTLYVIRPDGTVFESGDFRYNQDFWDLALVDYTEKDLGIFSTIDPKTFCTKTTVENIIRFYNMGSEPISSAKLEYYQNGSLIETIDVNRTVEVFNTLPVITPRTSVSETTEFELKVIEINGTAVDSKPSNTVDIYVHKTELVEPSAVVKFTTDYYPGELSWELTDDFDNVLVSAAYEPGNDDQYGGGGPDANKEFEYPFTVEDLEATCLKLTISDSFGDGMGAILAGAPIPGVEIYDNAGNLLKPKFLTDYRFTDTEVINTSASLTSSANDLVVNEFTISPNPASDLVSLKVDLDIEGTASLQIVNAMGQSVMQFDNIPSRINIGDLPSGNYSALVIAKEGTAVKRFAKI